MPKTETVRVVPELKDAVNDVTRMVRAAQDLKCAIAVLKQHGINLAVKIIDGQQ